GTTVMGYGVVQAVKRGLVVRQYGVIRLSQYSGHALKLKKIFERVSQLIDDYLPDEMAVEAPFYGKNVQSMLKLGRAQGVALAAALTREIPVMEYAPSKVKQAVTGHGGSSKEQVASMLHAVLQFGDPSEHIMLDATDALAVAVCHFHQGRLPQGNSAKSWGDFLKANPGRVR
ncbi:MAG: crossover junction endodeoxyribonuclease RuvC, partial [Catalinimonas sp.]